MKNKINIDIYVPSLAKTYNLFIPVNKTVGEIVQLINKALSDMTNGEFPMIKNLSLININTCILYNFDYDVLSNKIENGSSLILL